MQTPPLFQTFKVDISGISSPEKFTFPFYYEPHQLSKIAASELQLYLETQTDFEHNFGLVEEQKGLVIGKMFGVLVCQNSKGELGYLWAFSGKLAESNHLSFFVPPVFDLMKVDGFFKKEEAVLNQLNQEIERLEKDENYLALVKKYEALKYQSIAEIELQKKLIKKNKKEILLANATAHDFAIGFHKQKRNKNFINLILY